MMSSISSNPSQYSPTVVSNSKMLPKSNDSDKGLSMEDRAFLTVGSGGLGLTAGGVINQKVFKNSSFFNWGTVSLAIVTAGFAWLLTSSKGQVQERKDGEKNA